MKKHTIVIFCWKQWLLLQLWMWFVLQLTLENAGEEFEDILTCSKPTLSRLHPSNKNCISCCVNLKHFIYMPKPLIWSLYCILKDAIVAPNEQREKLLYAKAKRKLPIVTLVAKQRTCWFTISLYNHCMSTLFFFIRSKLEINIFQGLRKFMGSMLTKF